MYHFSLLYMLIKYQRIDNFMNCIILLLLHITLLKYYYLLHILMNFCHNQLVAKLIQKYSIHHPLYKTMLQQNYLLKMPILHHINTNSKLLYNFSNLLLTVEYSNLIKELLHLVQIFLLHLSRYLQIPHELES